MNKATYNRNHLIAGLLTVSEIVHNHHGGEHGGRQAWHDIGAVAESLHLDSQAERLRDDRERQGQRQTLWV